MDSLSPILFAVVASTLSLAACTEAGVSGAHTHDPSIAWTCVVASDDGARLVAGHGFSSDVLASGDNGETWSAIATLPDADGICGMHATSDRVIAISCDGAAWAVDLDGTGAERLGTAGGNATTVSFSPDANRVLVGSRTGGLSMSFDGARTWVRSDLGDRAAAGAAWLGDLPVVVTRTGELLHSPDRGESWTADLNDAELGALTIAGESPSRAWMHDSRNGLWSINRDASGELSIERVAQTPPGTLAVIAVRRRGVIAIGPDGAHAWSASDGSAWVPLSKSPLVPGPSVSVQADTGTTTLLFSDVDSPPTPVHWP